MEEEDECSDSDTNAAVGTTGATGVSGAGQSNLSTEVAALIQSELMRPRLRIGAGNSNAADVRRRRRQPRRSGDAAAPSNAAAPAAAAAAAAGDALAASGTDLKNEHLCQKCISWDYNACSRPSQLVYRAVRATLHLESYIRLTSNRKLRFSIRSLY